MSIKTKERYARKEWLIKHRSIWERYVVPYKRGKLTLKYPESLIIGDHMKEAGLFSMKTNSGDIGFPSYITEILKEEEYLK